VFSFEIDVAVDKGVATLRGTVDNLKAKRAAKRDAANTFGIAWVENYIKVRPEIVPPDDKLKHRVSNSLILDPLVERYDLTVVVRNGKVYVYGYVDSFYERFHVDDVISRVMGVAEVQNNVSVNYPYLYVTDSRIEREIRKNLLWSTLVDAGDISVSVQNGTATLSGTVDEWREYKAVIDNAFEGGARRVESNIRIAGQPDWKPPHHFLYEDFFGEIR
jgi:osmotically-inducible protein OsmY